jgi:23S rRNA pseudouridine1911/1915/1917 synthase
VVDKPANSIVQGAEDQSLSLLQAMKDLIKERDDKPGNVFLAPVHRLDRNVTGAVLFAKTSKGASRITETIKRKELQKKYQAITWGIPQNASSEIRAYFKKTHKKAAISDSPKEGFKEGILKFEILETFEKSEQLPLGAALIEVELITGRHHQIRCQFAHLNHPLIGDRKYSGKRVYSLFERPALHAIELKFEHPTQDKEVHINCPLPKDMENLLNSLR